MRAEGPGSGMEKCMIRVHVGEYVGAISEQISYFPTESQGVNPKNPKILNRKP